MNIADLARLVKLIEPGADFLPAVTNCDVPFDLPCSHFAGLLAPPMTYRRFPAQHGTKLNILLDSLLSNKEFACIGTPTHANCSRITSIGNGFTISCYSCSANGIPTIRATVPNPSSITKNITISINSLGTSCFVPPTGSVARAISSYSHAVNVILDPIVKRITWSWIWITTSIIPAPKSIAHPT